MALRARQQHRKNGEWVNGVVFSASRLGLVALLASYHAILKSLDEGAGHRFAASAAQRHAWDSVSARRPASGAVDAAAAIRKHQHLRAGRAVFNTDDVAPCSTSS